MLGTDIDARAIVAARANLASAGVAAELKVADALSVAPPDVTLIVTNPPMGRRSFRSTQRGQMLDRFLTHAADVLAASGRLVWVAPQPERSRRIGAGAGLVLESRRTIDMGGFRAELQRWVKPSRRKSP
jgi:tRNA G10  N-methylase Trm11